jgi:hypothetical protein
MSVAYDPKRNLVYHVSYDLNAPGQHYDKVIAAITLTPHIQVLKSSWLVETSEPAQALYERIRAVADGNDRLLVSELTDNHSGRLNTDACDWLKARMLTRSV